MKKLLILSILVLFLGSLIALESGPSETVGFVKYPCVNNALGNFNFIAMSTDAGYTVASQLGAVYPEISSIRSWDPVTQTWVSSDNFGGGFWFPDNALLPNEAYYVTVTAGVDMYIAGGMNATPSYNLVTNANGNFNALMLPFEQSGLTDTQLFGDDIAVCSSIREWDNTNQVWIASDNFGGGFWFPVNAVSTGNPYYVTVTANTTWPTTDAVLTQPTKFMPTKTNAPIRNEPKPQRSRK